MSLNVILTKLIKTIYFQNSFNILTHKNNLEKSNKKQIKMLFLFFNTIFQ